MQAWWLVPASSCWRSACCCAPCAGGRSSTREPAAAPRTSGGAARRLLLQQHPAAPRGRGRPRRGCGGRRVVRRRGGRDGDRGAGLRHPRAAAAALRGGAVPARRWRGWTRPRRSRPSSACCSWSRSSSSRSGASGRCCGRAAAGARPARVARAAGGDRAERRTSGSPACNVRASRRWRSAGRCSVVAGARRVVRRTARRVRHRPVDRGRAAGRPPRRDRDEPGDGAAVLPGRARRLRGGDGGALGAFGIDDSEALSYALVLHALNLVPYLVVGASASLVGRPGNLGSRPRRSLACPLPRTACSSLSADAPRILSGDADPSFEGVRTPSSDDEV